MSASKSEMEPLSTDLMLKTITALIRSIYKDSTPTVRLTFIETEWCVCYDVRSTVGMKQYIEGKSRLLYTAMCSMLDQLVTEAFRESHTA